MPRAPLLVTVLLLVAFATDAKADGNADKLFEEGLEDMRTGRYDTGCPKLAESHRLDPLPGALFTLAECEWRWGKINSAVTHYKEYLTAYDEMPPKEKAEQKKRAAVAKQQLSDLEPMVPTLTVKLAKGTPASARVHRNGAPIEGLGTPIPVDPGEHRLVVSVPGRPDHQESVVVTRAEKRQVVLRLPAEKPRQSDDDDDDEVNMEVDREAVRIAAIVLSAVSAAAGVASVITGGITLKHKQTIEDNCAGLACNAEGIDAADQSKITGTVSTVGLVVGAAGLATAIALWVIYATTEESPPRTERAHVGVALRPEGLRIQW